MKKFIAAFIGVVFMCSTAFAGPPRLYKGKPFTPPEDGYFFTLKEEQEIRYRLFEKGYIEKKLKLTEENVEVHKRLLDTQKQISEKYKEAWLETDKKLTESLKREKRSRFWHITLGVLLTVGAGLAIGFSAKAIK
jgi:hypothetical protein